MLQYSLAAINAVSAFKATTGLVADAMKALKSAIFNSVRLVWVPGHCGIEDNERVEPARQASLLFVLHWTWTICRYQYFY